VSEYTHPLKVFPFLGTPDFGEIPSGLSLRVEDSRTGEGEGGGFPTSQNPHLDSPALHRPLCLLTTPKPIRVIVTPSESREGHPISFTADGQVHRLVDVLGPERITGEWWTGHWKTRDYFDALDSTGNRYWLFRALQTGRWFLHGKFE
jgi:hypothetical protein